MIGGKAKACVDNVAGINGLNRGVAVAVVELDPLGRAEVNDGGSRFGGIGRILKLDAAGVTAKQAFDEDQTGGVEVSKLAKGTIEDRAVR